MVAELWYIHARNDFEVFRESVRHYDHSGEWRSKYYAMKKEVEEKFERRRAQLRQSYSQHDKFRQDRRVIMDPNLRLPKKAIRSSSSSSPWMPVMPKKNSLFEKARQEARKITQMYHSNPYPPIRSRTSTSSGNSSIGPRNSYRRIIAPTSTYAHSTTHTSSSSRNGPTMTAPSQSSQTPSSTTAVPNRTRRYSYKTRPVVYMSVSKATAQHQAEDSTLPSAVPASHKLITPSAPGAIRDFFNEINPGHTRITTTSSHSSNGQGSRSPTSPLQSPSKTIQSLRADAAVAPRYDRSYGDTSGKAIGTGPLMKKAKVDGDYSWLEDDDMDVDGDGSKTKGHESKKNAVKASESFEEAGRRFFQQLTGK
ncbi:hypothetical protein BGX34_009984 [Mortierella sp. NVP85]|nr:hypothetical protein BGX34_009984 [Mortierella sp. NVP85]